MGRDLSYAFRAMRRSPGFTAVAVLSLALGIGANVAIFSIVEAAMLRSLPVSRPGELVELLQKYPGEPRGNGYWSWASYEYFHDVNHVFSSLMGTTIDNRIRLSADGLEPQTGVGEYVTGNYFADLGVKPALGRLIGPDDDTSVAVLSWPQWAARFQKDPNIIGKRLLVQDRPATVIGVAPAAFTGLRVEAKTDVWVAQKRSAQGRMALLGRLKPGATLDQARAEMAVLFRFTIDERAASSKDPQLQQLTVQIEPAGNGLSTLRDRVGKPLAILMLVVSLLLLLTCVNIASMLLARAARRDREMAVRVSLGASGGRLLRQVLTESFVLSAVGTLIGAAIASFGDGALLRILASGREHERIFLQVQPDFQVLLFAAVVAPAASVVFGSVPAMKALRSDPALALRQAGSIGETRMQRLFGKSLVATQVAISLLLLSAAALFLGNLIALRKRISDLIAIMCCS